MYYNHPMRDNEQIFLKQHNPSMAEKDYLECIILDTLFKDPFFTKNFVFAGGGSITKAYSFSPRIGQDLDLAYTAFQELPDIHSKKQLNTFRRKFKAFVFDTITPQINNIINQHKQFNIITDREQRVLQNQEQWLSSPTIHIFYQSKFNRTPEDIRIEIIPRKYLSKDISLRSVVPYSIPTKRIGQIPTIAYQQTFWDKIFALHSNAISTKPHTNSFYSRHYFDVATLAERIKLAETAPMFSNIVQYQARYTTKNIGTNLSPQDVILIPSDSVLYELESDYKQLSEQTFCNKPTSWNTIITRLETLNQDLKRIQNQR